MGKPWGGKPLSSPGNIACNPQGKACQGMMAVVRALGGLKGLRTPESNKLSSTLEPKAAACSTPAAGQKTTDYIYIFSPTLFYPP